MSSDAVRGGLYVVSAPSGAGKTTLLKALIERHPRLAFSVSYTTRRARADEADGCDYHFIDPARFGRMCGAAEFLESALVFGNGYGTAAADVERLRAAGCDVVLEIDWQGARQVRAKLPEAVSIFILPPSRGVLRARLAHRGTDSAETIARRMAAAAAEIEHWCEYDYVIVNEDFTRALAELEAILAGRGEALGCARPGLAAFAAGLLAAD